MGVRNIYYIVCNIPKIITTKKKGLVADYEMCNLAFTTDQLILINSRYYVLRNTLKPRLKGSIVNDKFRDSLRNQN